MYIIYTNHARKRMKMRKIQEDQVAMTIEQPDQIADYLDGKVLAERKLGSRVLRVVYTQNGLEYVIISAMWR